LVQDRLWKGGACTKPVSLGQATGTSTTCLSGTSRLGQVVLVPVEQAGCLYQTCPIVTRKGQNRPLLVPWDKSYIHTGGLSLSRDKPLYTHNGACPSSTCSNLSHKVGLQGSTIFQRGHSRKFRLANRFRISSLNLCQNEAFFLKSHHKVKDDSSSTSK